MKKILYLITTTMIFHSCSTYKDVQDKNELIKINNIYFDKNNTLLISYIKNYDNNTMIWKKLKDKFWINVDSNNKLKKIEYNEINASIINIELPTIDDISFATNIDLPNANISYIKYIENNNYWDGKTFLVSIGINSLDDIDTKEYSDIYYFYIIKNIDNQFSISYIDKVSKGYISSNDMLNNQNINRVNFLNKKTVICINKSNTYYLSEILEDYFLNDNRCFNRSMNTIKLQKLYGDIYPIEYKTVIDKFIYNSNEYTDKKAISIFFDINDNMYLFYSYAIKDKGKYFTYYLYTPNNPTQPEVTQKLYFNQEEQ